MFLPPYEFRIGRGSDARSVGFPEPVMGGLWVGDGENPMPASVTKRVSPAATQAMTQYIFYVQDGGEVKVVVLEVTTRNSDLYAKVLSAKKKAATSSEAAANNVAATGVDTKLAAVQSAKGQGIMFTVGRACGGGASGCLRCTTQGGTSCLTCGEGYWIQGGSCQPSCTPLSQDVPKNDAVNLVIVGSGFAGQQSLWEQKAAWIFNAFKNYEPLDAANIPELNAFYAKFPAPDDVGTPKCNYGCSGIDRLLCCENELFERHAWRSCGSGFQTQILVVHNNNKYGGAGGRIATCSTNSAAPKVAVHEIGHSLFNFGDEYTYGRATAGKPNCDVAGCPKWSDLLGKPQFPDVACTGGRCRSGNFFAGADSMMLALNYNFGTVNRRIACCKFLLSTTNVPPYCNPFDQGEFNLVEHCKAHVWKAKDLLDWGGSSQPLPDSEKYSQGAEYVNVGQPVEWVLAKLDDEAGTWRCSKVHQLLPGQFLIDEVKGDAPLLTDGVITVTVQSESSGLQLRQLGFSKYSFVDVPPMLDPDAEGDPASEVVQLDRDEINLILNAGETCVVHQA